MTQAVFVGCVLCLSFSLLSLVCVWSLIGRVETDREATLRMRGDVERGIDSLSFDAADCRLATAQALAAAAIHKPKIEPAPKPGPSSSPSERFRRFMDEDEGEGTGNPVLRPRPRGGLPGRGARQVN